MKFSKLPLRNHIHSEIHLMTFLQSILGHHLIFNIHYKFNIDFSDPLCTSLKSYFGFVVTQSSDQWLCQPLCLRIAVFREPYVVSAGNQTRVCYMKYPQNVFLAHNKVFFQKVSLLNRAF